MAGLLDFTDPSSLGQLGMIGGLLNAKKGDNWGAILGQYAQQIEAQRQRVLQEQLIKQQLASGGIDLQSKQRAFEDTNQARDVLKGLSQPSMPQQQGVPQQPGSPQQSTMQPVSAPGGGSIAAPAPAGNSKLDTFNKFNGFADALESKGLIDQAKTYRDLAEKYRPKLKDTKTLTDPQSGQRVTVNFYEDGSREVVPFAPDKEKLHFIDKGGSVQGADPFSGAPVGGEVKKTMSPGEIASNNIARQNLAVRQFEVDPTGAFGINQSPAKSAGGTQQASGDQFLSTIPKPMADQVKALAEGRMQFPGGYALKSPYWQSMLSMVSQYDPNFDAVNYNARAATRKDFTSGKSAISLNALNTVMGHLDELDKAGHELNNTSIPVFNTAKNFIAKQTGDPSIDKFEATKQAVISEVEKAYRGSGGSEGDLQRWRQTASSASSPAQLRAVTTQIVQLLGSKIQAMGDQYNKGMGTSSDGLQLLNPKARETFKRLTGHDAPQDAQGGTEFKVLGKE